MFPKGNDFVFGAFRWDLRLQTTDTKAINAPADSTVGAFIRLFLTVFRPSPVVRKNGVFPFPIVHFSRYGLFFFLLLWAAVSLSFCNLYAFFENFRVLLKHNPDNGLRRLRVCPCPAVPYPLYNFTLPLNVLWPDDRKSVKRGQGSFPGHGIFASALNRHLKQTERNMPIGQWGLRVF
ncbi:hypothetical protein F1988_01430 [Alistipes indistinctus]|nr:hypothetical protein F1988_01430 [Alistipes indistinctus]